MITSAHNRQIKELTALISKHKERSRTGLFTAEGVKLFKEAPRSLIQNVFVSNSFAASNPDILSDVKYEIVEDGLFERICDTKTPQGILTVLKQPEYTCEDILNSPSPFIMVLEDVQDPGNVGTIIRTAEGAGVTGIILSNGCADIFSPKTIRSTMGSVFRVPFIYEATLKDAVRALSSAGITVYGAHLDGRCDYASPDYTDGTAFLIGNESRGLSSELAKCCDILISIPMEGHLESLNASVASAILMYTVHRKRNLGV